MGEDLEWLLVFLVGAAFILWVIFPLPPIHDPLEADDEAPDNPGKGGTEAEA